jgi:hypothetical protein
MITKCDVSGQLPWAELCGMRRFPLIVFPETLFEVCGHSHVALPLRRKTLNKVHVIHWSSFGEASEGILFRATNPAQSCEAPQRKAG